MTQTQPAVSRDYRTTVSAQTLAANLVIAGSVPTRIPASEIDVLIAQHGAEYTGEFVAALAGYGVQVVYEEQ